MVFVYMVEVGVKADAFQPCKKLESRLINFDVCKAHVISSEAKKMLLENIFMR
jgi:hypothetical protein